MSRDPLVRRPDYSETQRLDELRAVEYSYLDKNDHVYLDYTGAGLPAETQIRAHVARLRSGVYGNPHSENPASRASTDRVESARRAVLAYLNAASDEYIVIFTPNATGACRLVGEAYPFRRGRRFVLMFDNHNSVNGIREFARIRGARTRYVPVLSPDLRVDEPALVAALAGRRGVRPTSRTSRTSRSSRSSRTSRAGRIGRRRGLFAYPAQSNFSGVQHSLEWIEIAQEHGYDVLLDVAAFLPTNRLDLSVVHPDFVPISWYKVFGYPTGVGCLVARREALARLRRPWFSGGTIVAVSVQGDWHILADDETAFEDGTLNFLNIPDVEFGLSWVETVGIDLIQSRVCHITGWMLEKFREMRHSNGQPMVRVYGPTDTRDRGGTIALNFVDPDGMLVDERLVARESADCGISIRTGCFCNPGAGEGALDITWRTLWRSSRWGSLDVDEYLKLMGLPTGGAVRVSLGLASNLADAERFIQFAEQTYRDRRNDSSGLAPRLRC